MPSLTRCNDGERNIFLGYGSSDERIDVSAFGEPTVAPVTLKHEATTPHSVKNSAPSKDTIRWRLRSTFFSRLDKSEKRSRSSIEDDFDLEIRFLAARERWDALFAAQRAPVNSSRGIRGSTTSRSRPGHVRRASTNSIADLLQATKLEDRKNARREVMSDDEGGGLDWIRAARPSYPSRPVPPFEHIEQVSVARRPSFRVRTNLFSKQSSTLPPKSPFERAATRRATGAVVGSSRTIVPVTLRAHSTEPKTPPTPPRKSQSYRRKRDSTDELDKKASSGARSFLDTLIRSKRSAQPLKKGQRAPQNLGFANRILETPRSDEDETLRSEADKQILHITGQNDARSPARRPCPSSNLPADEFGQQTTDTGQASRANSLLALSSGKSDASSTFTVRSDPVSFTRAGLLSLPPVSTYRRFSEESTRSSASVRPTENWSARRMPLTRLSTSPARPSSSKSSPSSVYSTALRPPPRTTSGKKRPATAPSSTTVMTNGPIRENAIRLSLSPSVPRQASNDPFT
ncbi:hypothetical protein OIV83_006399 [Microbotryomycetes sp. JL201]|nr:hypothetical protein OIV83_006399 [Microbotryomycetes sp. JL201]